MFKKVITTSLEIDGSTVPLKIYYEHRNGARASIGKKYIIFRMPIFFSKKQKDFHIKQFTQWVKNKFKENKELKERFIGKKYVSGDVIIIQDKSYILQISYTDNINHYANLSGDIINLNISKNASEHNIQKSIKHLLSRLISQQFLPDFKRRVVELNHLYFQKPINNVRLKYNLSNWGSCSARGNLNFSTRLLFAPQKVIDYVIIHELAHLVEQNHSANFWLLVENAMPDYKKNVRWLKENGSKLDF